MADTMPLAGRVAVVTGGGRGLGRAMALGLVQAGASVAICGRDQATLDAAASAMGGDVLAIAADVSREADVLAVRDAALARWGAIHVLICNAGVNPIYKGIETTSLADWHHILDVNLTGTFLSCKHIGGAIGAGGSVICISSVAGHVGLRKSVPYCATKGGVELLVRALALDWAPRGVRVNCIAPGFFATDLTAGMIANPVLNARVVAATPMGRVGDDHDIAGAAVFLAGSASGFVTGQTLTVDGGYLAQ